MVSFSCEGCGDVLTKKKLDPHRNQCRGASYTCIDCMTDFYGTDYRSHTSCMSEAQKYQGALYRPEKEKKGKGKNNQNNQNNNNKNNNTKAMVARKAYVEDVPENYSQQTLTIIEETLPEAPDPPSAAPAYESKTTREQPNVFDYLDESETPNASTSQTPNISATPSRIYEDEQAKGMIVQYANGANELETPAPKRKDRSKKDDEKKDKKRKRLHVDTSPAPADEVMGDAPSSVLHTGLTGGLNRLLSRPDGLPPSPDYSGGDVVNSPASPIKRSKRDRASTLPNKNKTRDTSGGSSKSLGDTLLGMFTGGAAQKKSSSRDREGSESRSKKSKHTSTSRPSSSTQDTRVMKYDEAGPVTKYDSATAKKNASLFLDVVTKGADSEKGYSLNKALKRYNREKETDGGDEKELFKSLRLKKNDRGEVVVFIAN